MGALFLVSGSGKTVGRIDPEKLRNKEFLSPHIRDPGGWVPLPSVPVSSWIMSRHSTIELPFTTYLCGSCSSTFHVMEKLAREAEVKPWDSVFSLSQWAGIGQWSRRWISREGNVHATFVLPAEMSGFPGPLSLVIGFWITRFLEREEIPARIKWPNDIVIQRRKLGGILVRHTLGASFAGVGLNVNSAPMAWELETGDLPAISLREAGYYELDPLFLWGKALEELKRYYQWEWKAERRNFISKAESLLEFRNEVVDVIDGKGVLRRGRICAVGSNGGLIVAFPTGKEEILSGRIFCAREE